MEKTVVAGPCAIDGITSAKNIAEARERLDILAEGIALMKDIAKEYSIDIMLRGGAFKPRTAYMNGSGEKFFDGLEREGLLIHGEIAQRYGLRPVSELMSERDIPEFLSVPGMVIQIGARNAQNFALLRSVGFLPNDVIMKSDTKGYNPAEAVGSLQRLVGGHPDKAVTYCLRGQSRPSSYSPVSQEIMAQALSSLYELDPMQSPDYRNLNTIGAISLIRQSPFISENNIRLMYDPSHTIGGKTDRAKRDIGEYAIRALSSHGYDGINIEINIDACQTRCDSDQALPPSLAGIDWSRTQYGSEPEIKPHALNDILAQAMLYQVTSGDVKRSDSVLRQDIRSIREIPYSVRKPSYL